MSGTLEQEGTVDITNSGLLKIAGSTLSDASRNVTAVSLSGSNTLNVVGRAELKNELHVSGAAVFKLGASMGDANVTNVGNIALDSISADGASFSFGSNWTAAGRTCADGGIFTTLDLNGGTIDGTVIGAAAQSSVKATTLSASSDMIIQDRAQLKSTLFVSGAVTAASSIAAASAAIVGAVTAASLSASGDLNIADNATVNGTAGIYGLLTAHAGASMGDANITNVGDIALDSISADGASFSMGSNWTNAGRTVADGGIFTTLDLNGGSIDGTTIGAAAQSSVKATTLSGSGQGDVVGQFTVHGLTALSGAVDLRGVADTALAVANDSFYYLDVSDNLVKRDSMADYAAAIAGSGLAATAGVLSVDLNEAGAGVVDVAADSFTFIDANDSNAVKKDSYADYAAAIAGDGLKATAGVLSYDASELTEAVVNVAADSFIFLDADGSVTRRDSWADYATAAAGVGLRASAGAFELELSELGAGVIATGDSIAFVDSNDANASKKETVDDLANLFAGVGLSAASAVMALDLNELVAATVNVAADSIAIIDADDSNGSKKESIADLVTAMAGGGLTATNGVLSTQGGSAAGIADANATLAEGMNFGTTTFSADRTWTLPAAPDIGDIVHAKAPGSLGGNELIILKGSAAHRIDGAESLEIESDGGAISCMFVGSNVWVLF
tara:strand:- start:1429 stop:3456 length:2028 start_codon:yes stop_codon:yes gene_type:complete